MWLQNNDFSKCWISKFDSSRKPKGTIFSTEIKKQQKFNIKISWDCHTQEFTNNHISLFFCTNANSISNMKCLLVVTHFLVRTWLHPSDRRWPSAATAWPTSPSVRCVPRDSPDCDCRSQWPFTVTSFVGFMIQKIDVRWLTKKVVWNVGGWLFTVTVVFYGEKLWWLFRGAHQKGGC